MTGGNTPEELKVWEVAAVALGWRWSPAMDAYVHDQDSALPSTAEDACFLMDVETWAEALALAALQSQAPPSPVEQKEG